MVVTGLAQLRFAASLVLGKRFSLWALEQLIAALQDTYREFGTLGNESVEHLYGPALDESDRQAVHLRRFRTQAVRAAQETVYYQRLFAALAVDPAQLTYPQLTRLPFTSKQALREAPNAFVCATAQPAFCTTTTGTTGQPTNICFSAHEMQTYVALSALGLLARGEVQPADIVQLSTSSRATLGNSCFARACERIGAMWYQTGLVDPAQALALLAQRHTLPGKKPQTSYLNTYASYLGQLVEYGLAAGYCPADFGLERISVGGEVVTAGLKVRCQQLFGPVAFTEGYAMTETRPVGGTCCEQGHLHFEVSQALLELINPDTLVPALAGEVAMLVITPLPPYRTTTLVLRYQTEDLVRALAGPLTCTLHQLPATSNLLGKHRLSVRHETGWTCPRDVLEALEAIADVPLPARFGYWAVPNGVAVEVVVRADTAGVRRQVETALGNQGVPVQELRLVLDPGQLHRPFPLRCDLRELTFAAPTLCATNMPGTAPG